MNKNIPSFPGWEIVEELGEGGFGSVYKIKKSESSEGREYYAAQKNIVIPNSNDGNRYEEEFRIMECFKGNSNIVSYEDHMVIKDGQIKIILIRMELLKPINKICKSELNTEKAILKLGIDICHALELCHKKGIIHRDIKPENIFVNDFGDYKLGDFGISRFMEHTIATTITGTPQYMAPEVSGGGYNSTVDIYSLGLVLYWLLNDYRMPFWPSFCEDPSPAQKNEANMKRLKCEVLPEPKNGSDNLKKIILKACQHNPKNRYKSPTEMKEALEELLKSGKEIGAFFTAEANGEIRVSPNNGSKKGSTLKVDQDTVSTYMPSPKPNPTQDDFKGEKTVYNNHPSKSGARSSSQNHNYRNYGRDENKTKTSIFVFIILILVAIIIFLLFRSCNAGEKELLGNEIFSSDDGSGNIGSIISSESVDGESFDSSELTNNSEISDISEEYHSSDDVLHIHKESFSSWSSDSLNHWHLCDCGEEIDKVAHTFSKWKTVKAATETQTGVKERSCSGCGYKETEVIPNLEHRHSYATAYLYNSTTHWYQCECGAMSEVNLHNFGSWNVLKEASETETGSRERICLNCNYKETAIIPVLSHVHSYSAGIKSNETSHWYECSCGFMNELESHKFSQWIISKEATCLVNGSSKRSCSVCNYEETKVIPATGYITVTFDPNGGKVSTSTKDAYYENSYGALPIPTKDNYTFIGWYTAKTGGTEITASTRVTVATNQTLYAQWKVNEFTITFNADGGSVNPSTKKVLFGNTYGSLPTPVRMDDVFIGWYTAPTGGTIVTSSTEVTITANQTLYARWKAQEFIVTFDADGGIVDTATKNVAFGENYGILPTPQKAGEKFEYWMLGNDIITSGTKVSIRENHTLKAYYTKNQYRVVFSPNDESGIIKEQIFTYGLSQRLSENTFVKTNYSFLGWSANKAAVTPTYTDKQEVINLAESGSITLYAVWVKTTSTVSFLKQDGVRNQTFYEGTILEEKINPDFDISALKQNGYKKATIEIVFDCKSVGYLIMFNSARLVISAKYKSFYDNYWHLKNNMSGSWEEKTVVKTVELDELESDGSFYTTWSQPYGTGNGEEWYLGTTKVKVTVNPIE